MGVDYSAKYGIGVRLLFPETVEDRVEYVEEVLANSPYNYFEEGDEMYSGEDNWFYVVISNPFCDGFCALEDKANKLIEFLNKNNISYSGKVDLVGGLLID